MSSEAGPEVGDAMPAAKPRRTRLGRPVEHSEEIRRTVLDLRAEGKSLAQIAKKLTDDNVPTIRKGKTWHPSTVRSILNSARLDEQAVVHKVEACMRLVDVSAAVQRADEATQRALGIEIEGRKIARDLREARGWADEAGTQAFKVETRAAEAAATLARALDVTRTAIDAELRAVEAEERSAEASRRAVELLSRANEPTRRSPASQPAAVSRGILEVEAHASETEARATTARLWATEATRRAVDATRLSFEAEKRAVEAEKRAVAAESLAVQFGHGEFIASKWIAEAEKRAESAEEWATATTEWTGEGENPAEEADRLVREALKNGECAGLESRARDAKHAGSRHEPAGSCRKRASTSA